MDAIDPAFPPEQPPMVCAHCRRAVRYVEALRTWGHTQARTGRGHYIRPVSEAVESRPKGPAASLRGGPDTGSPGFSLRARRSTT